GLTGLDDIAVPGLTHEADDQAVRDATLRALTQPTPDRLRVIAQAFRVGLTVDQVNEACSYEPWFLRQIQHLVDTEGYLIDHGLPEDAVGLRKLKALGFSDARLARLTGATEAEVRRRRREQGVRP